MKTNATKKVTLSDVQAVFYRIIDMEKKNEELEGKRYLNYESAREAAQIHKGKVVRVTKRLVETMEFELAS